MKSITSEELLARSDEENMLTGYGFEPIKVICHDGEVITDNRMLQYAHGFYHFNRAYGVPIHAKQVFGSNFVPTPGGHSKEMEKSLAIVHDYLGGEIPKHRIAKEWTKAYDVHNNACIADLERFAATIDANDIMEILDDDDVIEMRDEMKQILASNVGPEAKSHAIIDCNDALIKHIKVNGQDLYPWNGVFQHIAVSSIKLDQLCQLINVVGYVTEIDSEIYPMPTAESFAEGMNYLYTYATNASLGKKAVMYNKTPIAETETLNRLVHQMCSQLENVHVGDCGSTLTSPILLVNHTAKAVVGMYHINSKGEVEEITKEIAEANRGRVLDVRTVAGCQHPDPVGRCSTCAGASTKNFVEDYNVGGASSCFTLGRNSQNILKTKHVEIINFVSGSAINARLRNFLTVSDNGKEIYLNENCSKAKMSFLATRRSTKDKSINGQYLQTLYPIKDFKETDLATFTSIAEINFNPNNGIDDEVIDARIKSGSSAHLSVEALEFLKANPEALSMYYGKKGKPFYSIDFSGFDTSRPLMTMPFKHYDSLTLHNQLETFFKSPGEKPEGEVLTDYNTFGAALTKFTEMTYGKLGVPMSVLQAMILPFTMRDRSKNDYRMTNNGDFCEFGKMEYVRRLRSLSVVTISSHQSNVYGHLSPLVSDNMMPHQYDSHFV